MSAAALPKFRLDYSFHYQNISLGYEGSFILKVSLIQKNG